MKSQQKRQQKRIQNVGDNMLNRSNKWLSQQVSIEKYVPQQAGGLIIKRYFGI